MSNIMYDTGILGGKNLYHNLFHIDFPLLPLPPQFLRLVRIKIHSPVCFHKLLALNCSLLVFYYIFYTSEII